MALREELEQETGYQPEEKDLDEQISERDKYVEEIAQREIQRRAESDGFEVDVPAPQAEEADPSAPDPAPAPKSADPEYIVLDGDLSKYRLKSKVDGEEEIVPLDPVVRQYQKDKAADKRLAEATRLLNEAREAQAKIAAPPEPEPQAQPANGSDEAFIESLFEGDKERAKDELRKILAVRQQPTPTVDPEQIARRVKHELSVESASEKFQRDNPDIIEDPYLLHTFNAQWGAYIQAGKDHLTAMKDAEKDMRDWMTSKGIGKPAPEPTTATRDEKRARKAEIDTLPTTSTRATIPEEKPQTASDIMEEMRKARGFSR